MLIKNKKINLINLGCRVNLFESSAILTDLKNKGGVICEKIDDADICIINTCTVTSKADSKSRYFINKVSKLKNIKLIIVIGCYSQLNSIENDKVGIVIGTKYKNKISTLIEQYQNKRITKIDDFSNTEHFEKFSHNISFISTRAFLKIQDGCDFRCSYCLIPLARGRQRSLHHDKVIELIKQVVNKGYKEIVLSGVNVAGYSDKEWNFYKLLITINSLTGNFRIRISSLEPFQINNKIIDLITSNPNRWCQQLHLCIQSASDNVIKDMNRAYAVSDFMKLCQYARSKNPLISLTTDYIVGFPTETVTFFNISLKNLKKIKFCNMHIFPFSNRKNTKASTLNNSVSDTEKHRRFKMINILNKKMQLNYLKQFVGKKVKVLFEKSNESNIQVGHSEYFFKVKIKSNKFLTGQLLKVKIKTLNNSQLFGEII